MAASSFHFLFLNVLAFDLNFMLASHALQVRIVHLFFFFFASIGLQGVDPDCLAYTCSLVVDVAEELARLQVNQFRHLPV